MYFDGGAKASLNSFATVGILRTVLVSQKPLKNTGPRAGNIRNQLRSGAKRRGGTISRATNYYAGVEKSNNVASTG